jgi:hypothetical protein
MAPKSNAPDIALVGAMKSATTSFANLMSQSRGICLAKYKEPGFFSRDEQWQKGIDWYVRQFAHGANSQLRLDASTCYTRSRKYPHAIERLHQVAPDALVVYILRHPVQRAYSHYYHEMIRRYLKGHPVVTMRDFFTEDVEGLSASFYDQELYRILALFPKSQVVVIRFDDFIKAPVHCVNQVLRRCEVDQIPATADETAKNTRQASGIRLCRARLIEQVFGSREMRIVRGVLPAKLDRVLLDCCDMIIRGLGCDRKAMQRLLRVLDRRDNEMDLWLHAKLDPHTKKLEEILGWDVSSWCVDAIRSPSQIKTVSDL